MAATREPVRSLEEAVRRIAMDIRPLKIILFGSRARGTEGPCSDVDLLVVADLPGNPDDRIRAVSRTLRPRAVPMDILVYTRAEFEQFAHDSDSFLHHVLKTGRVVYEAPDD